MPTLLLETYNLCTNLSLLRKNAVGKSFWGKNVGLTLFFNVPNRCVVFILSCGAQFTGFKTQVLDR